MKWVLPGEVRVRLLVRSLCSIQAAGSTCNEVWNLVAVPVAVTNRLEVDTQNDLFGEDIVGVGMQEALGDCL